MNTETLDRLKLEWSKIQSIGRHMQRFGGNEDAAEALMADSVTIVLTALPDLIAIARRAADEDAIRDQLIEANRLVTPTYADRLATAVSRYVMGEVAPVSIADIGEDEEVGR